MFQLVRSFGDIGTFLAFAKERAEALSMGSHRVPLSACDGWDISEDAVLRPDGRFFQVGGVHIGKVKNREVSGWAQPMICGETDGRAALVEASTSRFLVRLKAEPGNIGIRVGETNTRVLVAPGLQFSRSNLEHNERALRGETDEEGKPIKPVPLAGILTDQRFAVGWYKVPQDGGRFFEKVDQVAHVRVPDPQALDPDFEALDEEVRADFAWVSGPLLEQILLEGIANPYLWFGFALAKSG